MAGLFCFHALAASLYITSLCFGALEIACSRHSSAPDFNPEVRDQSIGRKMLYFWSQLTYVSGSLNCAYFCLRLLGEWNPLLGSGASSAFSGIASIKIVVNMLYFQLLFPTKDANQIHELDFKSSYLHALDSFALTLEGFYVRPPCENPAFGFRMTAFILIAYLALTEANFQVRGCWTYGLLNLRKRSGWGLVAQSVCAVYGLQMLMVCHPAGYVLSTALAASSITHRLWRSRAAARISSVRGE